MPPVPVHLDGAPAVGGLVIPYNSLRHRNGQAALGFIDQDRTERCLRERLCSVCARPIRGRMVFLMRTSDLNRRQSTEPALCPPCAAYAQRACPMIAGTMQHYRRTVAPAAVRRCGDPLCPCRAWSDPDASPARFGAAAEPWHALWTFQYRLGPDPDGRLAAGFAGLRVLAVKPVPGRDPDDPSR